MASSDAVSCWQVVQELNYMGVWVRIPLVHPEALDPEVTAPMPAVQSDGSGGAGRSGGGGGGGGGECDGNGAVEETWETWNTMRMLCEHKTG